ncbi:Auxin responsive SAUR protein [Artemisia annua]|uniref:Auxin responsive SAUR protein n=1 Tax=Artemisia annua TaxID=35608 RepID=A0A2U1KAE8_ARTAN|nr:Auxin responsive SAUR protein [Artemisia annua]
MGIIRLPSMISNAKHFSKLQSLRNRNYTDVPKGYLAIYVGEFQKRRLVVPISFLEQPLFQDLLRRSEEEFGFDHSMGGLTIHCTEDAFMDLTSRLPIS